MLKIVFKATRFAPEEQVTHRLNRDATTTLGSCSICDIRVNRRSIDDVHLVMRYVTETDELLIRDNKSESGTFQVAKSEALNPRSLYKFSLSAGQVVALQAGDVDI